MALFDYKRMVKKANKLIARFGQPTPAQIVNRETGASRDCTAVMIEYSWREQGLREQGARRFLISTLDPKKGTAIAAPNFETEAIVFAGTRYNFNKPDEGPRPGATTIFYDMEGVYDSGNL